MKDLSGEYFDPLYKVEARNDHARIPDGKEVPSNE